MVSLAEPTTSMVTDLPPSLSLENRDKSRVKAQSPGKRSLLGRLTVVTMARTLGLLLSQL